MTNPQRMFAKAFRNPSFVIAAALVCCLSLCASGQEVSEARTPQRHPLEPAIELAKTSQAEAGKMTDYSATFVKSEVVGAKEILHTMQILNRAEPFSVYLHFIGEHKGREVLYVAGANGGKLLVHETGLAGIVGPIALLPESREAMSESLYPITSIGIWNLVDKVIKQWERELQDEGVVVKYYPDAKLGKTPCIAIESSHPQAVRKGMYHKTRLFIDKETKLPMRVEQFGFPAKEGDPPPLLASYAYTGIKPNLGLTNADFDPRNPRYKF